MRMDNIIDDPILVEKDNVLVVMIQYSRFNVVGVKDWTLRLHQSSVDRVNPQLRTEDNNFKWTQHHQIPSFKHRWGDSRCTTYATRNTSYQMPSLKTLHHTNIWKKNPSQNVQTNIIRHRSNQLRGNLRLPLRSEDHSPRRTRLPEPQWHKEYRRLRFSRFNEMKTTNLPNNTNLLPFISFELWYWISMQRYTSI